MSAVPLTSGASPADLITAAGGAVAHGAQPSAGAGSANAAGFLALILQALQNGTQNPVQNGTPTEAHGPKPPVLDPAKTPKPAPKTVSKAPEKAPEKAEPEKPADVIAAPAGLPGPQATAIAASVAVAGTPAPVAAPATAPRQDTPAVKPATGQKAVAAHARPHALANASASAARAATGPGTGSRTEPIATEKAPVAGPVAATVAGDRTPDNGLPVLAAQGPGTTAHATPPAADHAGTSASVQVQVADKITSLVSRGNGTHRITMTLNPEQLGEVRVVMSVRDGVVQVRLAAGHEARAALVDGSAELDHLLTQAGATSSRIVVHELPTHTVTPTSSSQGSTTPDLGAGNAQPDARQQHQHARTRADQPAMDGSDTTPRPDTGVGATASRSIESVMSTRSSGLDVTM